MGSSKFEGTAKIVEMRQGMWTKILTRHHVVKKVFEHSETDLFLEGTVEYGLVNGKSLTVEWASHMLFDKAKFRAGTLLLEFYQVYIDMAPVIAAF